MGLLDLFSAAQDVRGKVVLITGAARGLGAGMARSLAERGAKISLVGLEAEQLHAVAAEIGSAAVAFEADVTDWDALRAAVDGTVAAFGRIDIVVANAGVASAGFMRNTDVTAFERVIEVDLLGVWRTVRSTLDEVIKSKGYVLIISSLAAVVHLPSNAPYNAAKAGVEALGNTLRAEVKHLGVDVGVGYLTWIKTDLVDGADEHPVFGPLRTGMPGPLAKTYPQSLAIDLLTKGIARRARAIHVPQWIWLLKLARAVLPVQVELGARFLVPKADKLAARDVEQRGAAASGALVGVGGRAAVRATEQSTVDTVVIEAVVPQVEPYGTGSHAALPDGSQPAGYPVKGNASSKLYHLPGTRFYQATVAQVWFASPADAEQAGFQLPKSQRPKAGKKG